MAPMAEETRILQGRTRFEPTRWSVVLAARDAADPAHQESWNQLVAVYWRPVYRAIRHTWNKQVEEAKDLTQEFFSGLFEAKGFRSFEPDRGRFRAYLKGALDHFMRNAARDAARLKRGGAAPRVPLDLAGEPEVAPAPDLFDREWRRTLLETALAELRAAAPELFEPFRRYHLDPARPTYREVAQALGIAETDVTNRLHQARAKLRDIVRRLVRETSRTDDDFDSEMRGLFGSP
jgi:RNA polymerase sigma factor (sigma-70 family)